MEELSALNDWREVSFHTAWKQSNSVNEGHSLTLLRVVCAIAGEWWKPTIWYHPYSLEQVMTYIKNCNKINDHTTSKCQIWKFKNTETLLHKQILYLLHMWHCILKNLLLSKNSCQHQLDGTLPSEYCIHTVLLD